MNPDENVEDPARKETQEFDPGLVDEKGIHPEPVQDAEPTVLQQGQREREVEEKPGHSGSWHTFKTS